MMTLSVVKSGAACGAEVRCGVSSQVDDRTFEDIERVFHDNVVIYFRGQQLSNEQHIGFSRRFGDLETHVQAQYLLPHHPEILVISNIKNDDGKNIGLADAGFTWHTDVSYLKKPSRCSLLYAKEVPFRDGTPLGDTVFTNTVAAYEALSESLKKRLKGLRAIHRYSARMRVDNSPRPALTKAQLAATPDVAHPIVRTHAWTGRKSLYVTAGECIGVEGLPDDEALALIKELHAHCIKPDFQYRHKWQVGDLLMWDNATSMHIAICDYQPPERRLMHRTTVAGAIPI
jgi:taurine dioxygenase